VEFELILVDNGSTDNTSQIAIAECNRLGLDYSLVLEERTGKVWALAAGLEQVRTVFVATFDADTSYPPDYLSRATALLREPKSVCAQAYYVRAASGGWRRLYPGMKLLTFTWLLPHQAHNGGAGQVFETEALRRAGGFDPQRWNFVLEDHEIVHRVAKLGNVRCSWNFWCAPARRHHDRPSIRWNFIERLAYHLTPSRFSDWYFYQFLRPRLQERCLSTSPVREQSLTSPRA
jgi:glycosyltransferase involved in cell wall biosynthesis